MATSEDNSNSSDVLDNSILKLGADERDEAFLEFQCAIAMSHELESLSLMLVGQELGNVEDIWRTILNKFKVDNFNPQSLAPWATNVTKIISFSSAFEKWSLGPMWSQSTKIITRYGSSLR